MGKGMTCGVPMSVSGERGLQQGRFGLYDNTDVCIRSKAVEDVENNMFESSNKL